MKIFTNAGKFLLMFLAILTLSNCQNEHAKEPEEMGKEVVNFLKENDKDGYLNYVTTNEEEYLKIFQEIMNIDYPKPSPSKSKRISDFKKNLPKMIKDIESNFDKKRRQAERKIDWDKVRFVETIYEELKENDLSVADITVIIECEGIQYEIAIQKCVKFEGRWYTFGGLRWRGER